MSALRKVLVVDDDPVVGKSFDRVLSAKGYAVITAGNAQEALNKLDAEDYDVVFTDIKMPGMSGLEMAEQVRQRRPWLPVVIVTGYGSPGNEARAEAAGVSGFLRKPLSPEMIEGSAAKALSERDATAPSAAAAATQPAAIPPSKPRRKAWRASSRTSPCSSQRPSSGSPTSSPSLSSDWACLPGQRCRRSRRNPQQPQHCSPRRRDPAY